MPYDKITQQLIWAGKVLAAEGQDDFTRGHISFRLPDASSQFFMKPHSVGLDEITMENILTIDLEGNVVAGISRRHSEVYIHSEIYKLRPDVHCVIHTHPPYSVALSATGRPMRCYEPTERVILRGARGLHRYDQPDPQSTRWARASLRRSVCIALCCSRTTVL